MKLSLSPNPLRHDEPMTVHLAGDFPAGKYELRIIAIPGNILLKRSITLPAEGQNIPLNISGLPAGAYMLEMINEQGMASRTKFVKED